jgi:hypothetical protein
MSDSTASATAALAAISSPSPSIGFTRLPSLEVLKQLSRDDLLKSIAGTLIMEALGIYAKAGDTESSDVLGVSFRVARTSAGKAPEKHVDHWIYICLDDDGKLIIDGVTNGDEPSDLTQALRGYIILVPALHGRFTFGAEIKAANLEKNENLLAVTNVAFWEATRKQPVEFRDGSKAPKKVFSAQQIRDHAQSKKRSADGELSKPLMNKNERFDAVVAGLKRAIGDDELVNMALTYGECV